MTRLPIVADQQILRGASATLTVTLYDSDGEPADASGTLTVGVTGADGTEVLAAGTATTAGTAADGIYTRALTAAQTADLDILTATWTDAGDSSTHVTYHEIVGGYYWSVAALRATETSLANAATYPSATVQTVRREVEEEFERICRVAFVPRFRRVRLDGSGTPLLVLPDPKIRSVQSVRVYTSETAYTAFTSAELAAVEVSGRTIIRRDGDTFDAGAQNIVVEYEHGHDRPPAEVRRASMRRARARLNAAKSGVPERAMSYTAENGATYRIDQAGPYKTGDPDIDAVLARWSARTPGVA